MHLRKLVLACGFASFALSNYASALGLGEVKLKSTLNQPLSAEVQLLDTKGLSPEQIIVGLASSSEFERNGLDFVHFYSELKFEVALDNPSGPVVRITSRNPVREPYLNFLIEAKWTSGRLLREYTLLMDLPTYDEAAPQAVQAAKAESVPKSTSTAAPESEVATPRAQAPAPGADEPEAKPDIIAEQDQPEKKPKVSSGTYGPVGDRDTLWEIALAVRPDSSTSVHQTMLALQRLNPEAFIRGNINLLKKGQVLRVPDASEVSSISQSEAVRQFNSQSAEWSGNSGSSGDSALGAQLDASRRTTTERAKSEAVAGRVRLEAPTAKEKAAGGQGSGANKGSGRALESELATTLEELERAKSEKTELSSRVHDLEEQVKTMQRLVDVSNEKLRALQLNSGKQPDQKVAETQPSEAVGTAASSAPAAATQAASSAAAAVVAPKKPAVRPAPAPAPEKTIADKLSDNILWVGLGAVAVLGLGGFALARRRKEQAEAEHRHAFDEDLQADEPSFESFNQTHEEQSPLEPAPDEIGLFDEKAATAVAETDDVVGEADIYMALGNFDQAEEMLVNGLAKDPGSTDIRLKLLELYSQTKNAAQFDKHYAVLLPLASGLVLNRAKEFRANIPGIGEFNPELAQAEEHLDFGGDFRLDDLDTEPQAAENIAREDSKNEFEFDLDLNHGDEFTESLATSEPGNKIAELDDDFALDFDLDDAGSKHGEAEDLSDISLALDDLEDETLPEDIEVSKRDEDDFNFDLDEAPNSSVREVEEAKPAEFNESDILADDFNLEMDVDKVDLAALDDEMASLDAEFEKLDGDDFKLEDLDSDLADLDSDFDEAGENSASQNVATNSSVEAPDFSWEDDELEFEEPLTEEPLTEEPLAEELASESDQLLAEEELTVEDDDSFDLDDPVDLANEASLEDLDQALFESEDEPDFDANAFAESDSESDRDPLADLDSDYLAEESTSESAPITQEELAQLENIDEEAVEEITQADAVEDMSDDDVFEQALSDFSAESLAMDDADMSDDDMDAELDFMADADEAATKLDLARAYMDMGDNDGARDILAEVAHEGNEQQRQEAADLLSRIDA